MLAGIFVGGAASRFGGIAKGMLLAPSEQPAPGEATARETVIGRLVRLLRDVGAEPILVGERPGYEMVGLPTIRDLGTNLGPMGGLCALYRHVLQAGEERVVVIACDMPFVSAASLRRLCAVPAAPLAAARRDGRWEPFFSVHDARVMLPRAEAALAAGRVKLQALFDGAVEVAVDPHELDDWDSPDDQARTTPIRTMSK